MSLLKQIAKNVSIRADITNGKASIDISTSAQGLRGLSTIDSASLKTEVTVENGVKSTTASLRPVASTRVLMPEDKIVELTADVPGYESTFSTSVQNSSKVNTLTGSSIVSSGENKVSVGLGTPEAIAATLEVESGKKTPQALVDRFISSSLKSSAAQIFSQTPPEISAAISVATDKIVDDVLKTLSPTFKTKAAVVGILAAAALSNKNIIREALTEAELGISDEVKDEVETLIFEGDKNEAIEVLQKNSTAEPEKIEEVVNTVDVSLDKNFSTARTLSPEKTSAPVKPKRDAIERIPELDPPPPPPASVSKSIAEKYQGWRNRTLSKNMSYEFAFIDGKEELLADMIYGKDNREITTMIYHWSANYKDDYHVNAKTIHDFHVGVRKYAGCGYNYVILRDGRIQRGRPITLQGAHVKGKNKRTIGVCGVGGLSVTRQKWQKEMGRAYEDAPAGGKWYSDAQMKSFKLFAECFYTIWSGGLIYGHSDVQSNKSDPGWSEDLFPSMFGKSNRFSGATVASRFPTTQEIIKGAMV